MSLFSEIERAVERGFRRWTEKVFGEAESDDLVLVHRSILERVESRIEPAQRGRPIFPYNHIAVRLGSPDEHRRATYSAALLQDARLEGEIREFLTGAGCQVPRGFAVDLEILDAPAPALEVVCDNRTPASREQAEPSAARLVVITGKTAEAAYRLTKACTNIGRMQVLLDRDQRPIRRNDVVFEEDAGEVNTTVSRSHAHVRHDPGSGEYRVCDDGSEYGTRVFRDGRAIEVPPGNRRGERLRPGDEIYFGRACARFEVD